jgi:MSHA biogenesis protein MshJ
MKLSGPFVLRLTTLAERLDGLSIRERGLIFFAGATLVYIAWQTLLMGPLTMREQNAEQRLTEARRRLSDIEHVDSTVMATADPLISAANRNRALEGRLKALDAQLQTAAQDYVAPQRMTAMLREMLAQQHGLRLVSLVNLPVVSLSPPPAGAAAGSPASKDLGPFLHPVELAVDGDYASILAYLRALEGMPWRMHWQQLDLRTGDYPVNHVRIVIGALSLSRDWISL